MMDELNILEKKFFIYLQKHFPENDFIKLGKSFVPSNSSNSVNRFYSNNDSIWFSRLEVSNNKKIYYFGIMDNPTPKLAITYNTNKSKSILRFTKSENVYLKIKAESNVLRELNSKFTLKYVTRNKSSDYYFLNLGKINTPNLMENIQTLIRNFVFIFNLKINYLNVKNFVKNPSVVENSEKVDEPNMLSLKSNMDAIKIQNSLLKKNISSSVFQKLKQELFTLNDEKDYSLNPNFKNKFNLSDEEIYSTLNDSISKIDESLSYDEIIGRITSDMKNTSAESNLSEREQMDLVLQGIKDNKSDSEITKLTGISQDSIYEWYENGENSKSENTIYFYNKLNEILFSHKPEDLEDRDEIETKPEVLDGRDDIETKPGALEGKEDIETKPEVLDGGDDIETKPGALEGKEDIETKPEVLDGRGDIETKPGALDGRDEIETKPSSSKIYNFNSSSFSPGKDIYQEVKDKFPLDVPRNDQLELISEVACAINNGYKYIILEAGTGIGKSVIAATLARIYESSYILTVTKQLQNQYYEDFKEYGFKLVKGRQNFKCINHKNVTCDKGDCVLKNKSCKNNLTTGNPLNKLEKATPGRYWKSSTHCPYWSQKVDGLNSKVVIANYDFGLYDFNLSHYFGKRKLLILDEAHNLENKIMSFISLDLNKNTLKKDIGLNLDDSTIKRLQDGKVSDWIDFVKNVKEKYDERAKIIVNQAKAKGEDESFIKDLEKELKIESSNRERFIRYISNDKNNWICDYDYRNEILSFKPLSVKKYTHDYLFNYGDVCIFMSATILNHKKFAEWMGIDINEVYSIHKDSPFNSSDNPIIVKDSYNMASGYLSSNAPKTIPVLNEILAKHKNEKGLIHTVSNNCKKYILKHVDNDRLMTHTTKNREKKLEKYKSSKNSVLVSPSMSEGVDLPGEQCRFQVIYKLPYMTLTDQVRQRINEDEDWYDYRTSIALVQTFGRGIRFDGDYCTTYVVDSRFKEFIKNDKEKNHFIPDYVLKAIK